MRLQEVLKEREAEISSLEQSLKESSRGASALPTPMSVSPTTPSNGDASLSPKTLNNFNELRGALDNHTALNGTSSDVDETHERLNELMRYVACFSRPDHQIQFFDTLPFFLFSSMAQKESSHREHVDKLSTELSSVRRQYDELTVLSRNQVRN